MNPGCVHSQAFDYNGGGRWTLEAVQRRYSELARRFHIESPADLTCRQQNDGTNLRVYPVMEFVIDGIEAGNAACVELGVEFIESDEKFPFGKALKSRAARALRRTQLTPYQIDRIRKRVIRMLVAGHIPHEFGDYARLLRRIGTGPEWPEARGGINRTNPYVDRFCRYIDEASEDSLAELYSRQPKTED